MEGVCIVVSPLIALMKDQVDHLLKRQIPAAAVFSGMKYKDIDRILDNAAYGGYKFLYLSPERLTTELAQERIKKMDVSLLAVDEAHCISQWGYDFRPPYLQIAAIREHLPGTPVMALTATATDEVIKDIQEKLEFRAGSQVFIQSFERKNLAYIVRRVENKEEKAVEILTKIKGSGIVYVRNRKKTKDIAELLQRNGIDADYYHAGLNPEERTARQDAWMENKKRIMVSTNAFGMGVDKPNVRTVIHMDLPDNIESYFQEAGRAGRDGKKAYAALLYNPGDRAMLEKNFALSFPDMKELRKVYQALGSYLQLATGSGEGESFDFDLSKFTQRYQLDVLQTHHSLRILETEGWIALSDSFYQPSTILITATKEEIYRSQVSSSEWDKTIKAISRTLQGVFTHPAPFMEHQLATFMKISVIDLKNTLEALHQAGVVEYTPFADKPQLTFLKPRADARHFSINHNLFQFRKKRAQYRMSKALEYAELNICRSRQLLRYFGEKQVANCGVCDVCLEKETLELSPEAFETYQRKIEALLRLEPLTLKEVADSFHIKNRSLVLKVLEFLLDAGKISIHNDVLSI